MSEKELYKWLEKNYDFKSQKWVYKNIPDEVLDCILNIMEKEDDFNYLYSKLKDYEVDFISDFICNELVYWKQWKIIKLWLKGLFKEKIEEVFN